MIFCSLVFNTCLSELVMASAIRLQAFQHEFSLRFREWLSKQFLMQFHSFKPTVVRTFEYVVWLSFESLYSDMCNFMQKHCNLMLVACVFLRKMNLFKLRIAQAIVLRQCWINKKLYAIFSTVFAYELVCRSLSHIVIYKLMHVCQH